MQKSMTMNLVRIESIINSMTKKERKFPDLINDSRIKRISAGSGQPENQIRELLGKFRDMRDLMVAMGGGKIRGRWKGFKGLKKMFGNGQMPLGADQPNPSNPFGLPEVKSSKQVSKKSLEKQRKKNKDAKKARKKSKKR